jgi:catalase
MKWLIRVFAVLALGAGGAYVAVRLGEAPPPDPGAAIREIGETTEATLKAAYPQGGKVLRAAHAKAHGCVKAVFTVDPALPQDWRVGTFATPGQKFKALIRFSNSAFRPGADSAPNGRGLAVKLLDAAPEPGGAPRGSPPHDLLFINHPVYFLADLRDFLAFARAGALIGDVDHAKAYFFPGANPFGWRWREAAILFRNATAPAASPLNIDYWSMTPYRFGAQGAIKYAARPCEGADNPGKPPENPDYLRQALANALAGGPACLALLAQKSPEGQNLDDATRDWPTPFQALGRLDMPAQDIAAPGRAKICENLAFNPVHAPEALAPLGGINAARVELYEKSRAYRMNRNGAAPVDPYGVWDGF